MSKVVLAPLVTTTFHFGASHLRGENLNICIWEMANKPRKLIIRSIWFTCASPGMHLQHTLSLSHNCFRR